MERKAILLIEDDEPVRMAIKDALEREYRIFEASRFSEAVHLHKNHFVNLALIDYSLPGRDGLEVLRVLRDKEPSLPAILMTAYSSESVAIEAARAGVSDYLKKPLSLKFLLHRLSEIFDGKEIAKDQTFPRDREEFILDSIALHIENKFMEDLSLERVSAMANMDRFSFCRAFKKRFGQNFVSYLNGVRIRNAAELLKNDLSVTKVASFVGYRSIEYFNRVFKEVHGVSPREYRKRFR